MDEENNVTGVTEDTYASMLGEAIKSKDAEIAALKAAQATRVKELTDMVLNGGSAEPEEKPAEDHKSRQECLKAYRENKFNSDLEYWENFLDLRDATIREFGKDPCVTGSYGHDKDGNVVEPEYGEAEEVAAEMDTIRSIVEECKGQPELFSIRMKAALKK